MCTTKLTKQKGGSRGDEAGNQRTSVQIPTTSSTDSPYISLSVSFWRRWLLNFPVS